MRDNLSSRTRSSSSVLILLLAGYMVLAACYFVLRFAGNWSAGDMQALTSAAATIQKTGTLLPESPGQIYWHGMTYQTVSVFLSEATAVSLQTLQARILPLAAAVVGLMAFVAYRRLVQDKTIALLAALLLCFQGDFLFVILRGSHEKVTWLLVLTALFLLAKSFAEAGRIEKLIPYVALFYLVAFGLGATNSFFAFSFTSALSLSFALGHITLLWTHRRGAGPGVREGKLVQRLLYVSLVCLGLLYIVMFYLYPPAGAALRELRTLGDRLAVMTLRFEPLYSPYDYISFAWIDARVYLAVAALNYIILFISFLVWFGGLLQFLRKDAASAPKGGRLLVWLLYAGLALQFAVSLITDQAGWVGGTLQVRLFTPLMLIAVPLAATGIVQRLWAIKPRKRQAALAALVAMPVAWFSVASLLKATNEPLLNNQWLFFTTAEREAGRWTVTHVGTHPVWVGIDVRMRSALSFSLGEDSDGMTFQTAEPFLQTRDFLLSEVERLRYQRIGVLPPSLENELTVYDNGGAQIFHSRPLTPYQR